MTDGLTLEPQITLKSIDGDQVTCHASQEWKQKLVDFLDYAHDDAHHDVYMQMPEYEISVIHDAVAAQINGDELVLPNYFFSRMSLIFISFGHISTDGVYECYNPEIFCRLHDDIETVVQKIYNYDPPVKLRMPDLIALQAKEHNHG